MPTAGKCVETMSLLKTERLEQWLSQQHKGDRYRPLLRSVSASLMNNGVVELKEETRVLFGSAQTLTILVNIVYILPICPSRLPSDSCIYYT